MARAFVIRPFGKKKDTKGNEFDFELVHNELIKPAIQATGFSGSTTAEVIDSGNILADMFSLILEADLVICDVTIHNANVFYELGIRHALRKKRTILIRENESADNTPFNILTFRFLPYSIDDLKNEKEKLIAVINSSERDNRETDSPVFTMLSKLPEADPEKVQVLPLDFQEEVKRAQAAKSKGWLRLLAQDVRRLRFQRPGLKYIADAQWGLKDYEGAQKVLEDIRERHGSDISANLSLASIYERLYRIRKDVELLVKSNQALERVLESERLTLEKRVEALALKGRNLKTQWREEFEDLDSVDKRRTSAKTNAKLRDSYLAYREAFYKNLNHFYSGLGALQMGTIFLELSKGEDDSWKDIFESDDKADNFRRWLVKQNEAMQTVVSESVKAGLIQLKEQRKDLTWGKISQADLRFLIEKREQQIINFYRSVIPKSNPFAWDAAKGQLQLFADLNVRGELAQNIIKTIDEQQGERKTLDKKSKHLVLFVGHQVDEMLRRQEPRFPADQEDRARKLIKNTLEKLQKDMPAEQQLIGLASAASGADIIFHEVCEELNIQTTICLPMPSADYVRHTFKFENGTNEWQNRYIRLKDKLEILLLSDRKGLPNWLDRKDVNEWERGNRWVLQMGLSSDAEKTSLIAFWDHQTGGKNPSGTAHMVRIARETGRIEINVINSNQLL